MAAFSGILDIGKLIGGTNRWKRIVTRFVGNLKRLISKTKGSPKVSQVLLYWCYELKI